MGNDKCERTNILARIAVSLGHDSPLTTKRYYLQEMQCLTQDGEERIRFRAIGGDDDES